MKKVSSMPRLSYPNSGLVAVKRPSSSFENKGTFLKTDTFIHGDACLPNFILKEADHFSCFIDLGLADFSDRHIDLFWAVWSLNYNLHDPKYAELFLDYYGIEQVDVNKLRLVAAFEAFG